MNKRLKVILLIAFGFILSSCNPLYYGFMPGTDYKIFKLQKSYDLKSNSFAIEYIDSRENVNRIDCSEYNLDRNTELEGELGFKLLQESINKSIENSNGKIDRISDNKYIIKLEGISFKLIGVGFIVAHGFIQFEVIHNGQIKKYCSDMTDMDNDSPLHWYSLVTRKTGSRLILSGSLNRAVENFVKDLNEGNI